MKSTRAVVFGYDHLLLTAIEVLASLDTVISSVVFPVTRADENANAVRAAVAERGLAMFEMHPNDVDALATRLRELEVDIFLIWSFPIILPKNVIDLPRKGAVNIHMGLLPEYRGVNGIRWALLNGESQTGATLHFVDEGIDTGDMIARAAFPIEENADIRTLMIKSRSAGIALLKTFWPQIVTGNVKAQPQDKLTARYYSAKMLPPAVIDWNRSGVAIRNHIRAFSFPFEGAGVTLNGESFKVTSATLTVIRSEAPAGTVLSVKSDGVLVATVDDAILLTGFELNGETVSPQQLRIAPESRL